MRRPDRPHHREGRLEDSRDRGAHRVRVARAPGGGRLRSQRARRQRRRAGNQKHRSGGPGARRGGSSGRRRLCWAHGPRAGAGPAARGRPGGGVSSRRAPSRQRVAPRHGRKRLDVRVRLRELREAKRVLQVPRAEASRRRPHPGARDHSGGSRARGREARRGGGARARARPRRRRVRGVRQVPPSRNLRSRGGRVLRGELRSAQGRRALDPRPGWAV